MNKLKMLLIAATLPLLVACGGGSGGGSASELVKTFTPSYSSDVTISKVNVEDAALLAEASVSILLGDTIVDVWQGWNSTEKQTFVNIINAEEDNSGSSLITIADLQSLIDSSGDITKLFWGEIRDEVRKTASQKGYYNASFSIEETRAALRDAVSTGATEVWRTGITGAGVTISADNEAESIDQAARAIAIAPNLEILAPRTLTTYYTDGSINRLGSQVFVGKCRNSDVCKLGVMTVMFDRLGSDLDFETFENADDAGIFAGIGALVLEKFQSASNTSVKDRVNSANGDAREAVSPQ